MQSKDRFREPRHVGVRVWDEELEDQTTCVWLCLCSCKFLMSYTPDSKLYRSTGVSPLFSGCTVLESPSSYKQSRGSPSSNIEHGTQMRSPACQTYYLQSSPTKFVVSVPRRQ